MGYKLKDFGCKGCGHEWEELLWNEEVPSNCPKCNSDNVSSILTATGIAAYSIRDKDAQWAVLRKRSEDHTAKMKKRGEHIRPKKTTYKPGG